MKKLFFLFLISIFIWPAQAQNQAKRFAVKSGKLVLKLDGSSKGTRTIYFDDYGSKYYETEESVTEITLFGITDRTETHKTTIMNEDKYWSIDLINGENYSGTLGSYQMSKDLVSGMSEKEQQQLVDNVIQSLGGQRLGQEDVEGYSCEKINVMGINIWLYKGLALRTEGSVMGVNTKEKMISFEENISIPDSKFQPPQDIEFTNTESLQASYGQMGVYEDELEKVTENLEPLEYSFDAFSKVVNQFTPEGYARTMVMNQDGQYMALYNQGFTNIVAIIATAASNIDGNEDEVGYESFNYKGKTIHYGEMDSEGMSGKGLLIPYEEHHMYIMIMSMPGKDKESMLNWLDELDF